MRGPLSARQFVGAATPLIERACGVTRPLTPDANENLKAQRLLSRWQSLHGRTDEMRRRLRQLGVDDALSILGPVEWAAAMPDWWDLFEMVTDSIATEMHGGIGLPDLPFESLTAPFAQLARRRVYEHRFASLIEPTALDAAELALRRRLSHLSATTWALEFRSRHAASVTGLARLRVHESDVGSAMRQFTDHMLSRPSWLAFFGEHPPLGRLLSIVSLQWAASVAEMLTRLREDRRALEEMFGGRTAGRVRTMEIGLSDPHEGGRSVVRVQFEHGHDVYYKPRPVDHELLLIAIQHRLAGELRLNRDCMPWVMARSGYGWMSKANHAPLNHSQAAELYYERMGTTLAFAHILCGTDLHHENVVAAGDQPVIIDAEAFFYPGYGTLQELLGGAAHTVAMTDWICQSVLMTGLLPRWELEGDVAFDVSATGATQDTRLPGAAHSWRFTGSSYVERVRMPLKLSSVHSLPHTAQDEVIPVAGQSGPLEAGFVRAWRVLRERAHELGEIIDQGTEHGLRGRFLLRHTDIYALCLQRLAHPEFMRNAAERSLELEALARPFLRHPKLAAHPEVLRAELWALESGVIPRFATLADSTDLLLQDGSHVRGFFDVCGLEQVRNRISLLHDESECTRQIEMIRAALAAHEGGIDSPDLQVEESCVAGRVPPKRKVDGQQEKLMLAAAAIGEQLARAAIISPEGNATWLGFAYHFAAQRYTFAPLRLGLYDGAAGIALALSALADALCDERLRTLALASLRPLEGETETRERREALRERIGMDLANGTAGLAFAMQISAQLLRAPRLAVFAQELIVEALEACPLDGSVSLADLLGGVPGVLSSAAFVQRQNRNERIGGLALDLGEALSRKILSLADEALPQNPGFAHGQAGLLAALRSVARLGSREPIDLCVYRFEQRLHDAIPLLMTQAITGQRLRWCSGDPGVALAICTGGERSSMHAAYLRKVLDQTGALSSARDHICCGNVGRLEVLHDIADCLTDGASGMRPVMMDAVSDVCDGQRSWHLPLPRAQERYCPGFFQGLSGISYSLLRLAFPERYPSVLALGTL